MLLIYLALFFTVLLIFWSIQVYDYRAKVDDNIVGNFIIQMNLEHEQAISTLKDPFLGSPDLTDYLDGTGLPLTFENPIVRKCYDTSGAVLNCYDDNMDPYIYKRGYDTSDYKFISRLVGDGTSGWLKVISFMNIINNPKLSQRDLYASFVDEYGNNATMGLLDRSRSSNGAYTFSSGEEDVPDIRAPFTAFETGDCFDDYGDCFVMVTDIAPIDATYNPKSIDVEVALEDIPANKFTYPIKPSGVDVTFEGTLLDGREKVLSLTVRDENPETDNRAYVDLEVSVSAYNEAGEYVPSLWGTEPDNDPTYESYNQYLVDVENIYFTNNSGTVVDNFDSWFDERLNIHIVPNYGQIGAAYVTVKATYKGTDATGGSNKVDTMTFLIISRPPTCDADGDGIILEEDGYWEKVANNGTASNNDDTWWIGGYDPDDTEKATEQLWCLARNQTAQVLSSSYKMRTDANFGFSFKSDTTYQNYRGIDGGITETVTNQFLGIMDIYVEYFNPVTGLLEKRNPPAGWIPLGRAGSPFTGDFDGDNHNILNLVMHRPSESDLGFFGRVRNSEIKDLEFRNPYIKGTDNIGILAGYVENESVIDNVQATNANVFAAGKNIGGLIGRIEEEGELIESSFEGDVYNDPSLGDICTGGLVGAVRSATVTDSTSSGNVTAPAYVGGLIGCAFSGTVGNDISGSYSTADVFSTGMSVSGRFESSAGGLIGLAEVLTMNSGHAEGDVRGGGQSVGGLIGRNLDAPSIIGVHAMGNVYGFDLGTGGLIGNSENLMDLRNSYATGSVLSEGSRTGGLIGSSTERLIVDNSYSTGNVEGYLSYAGGLVGCIDNVTNNNMSILNSHRQDGSVISRSNFAGGLIGGIRNGRRGMRVSNSYVVDARPGPMVVEALGSNTGGLIGGMFGDVSFSNDITIYNSYVQGIDITGEDESVGGLVGGSESLTLNIDQSRVRGINLNGTIYVGGLVGINKSDSNISDSNVISTNIYGYKEIGGIIGSANGGSISNSTYESIPSGNASGWSNRIQGAGWIGGIAGALRNTNINGGFVEGFIHSDGRHNNVGGVAGYANNFTIDGVRIGRSTSSTTCASNPTHINVDQDQQCFCNNPSATNWTQCDPNTVDPCTSSTFNWKGGSEIGGITGYSNRGTIRNSSINVRVGSQYASNIGGVVGYGDNMTIRNIDSLLRVNNYQPGEDPSVRIGGIIGISPIPSNISSSEGNIRAYKPMENLNNTNWNICIAGGSGSCSSVSGNHTFGLCF